VTIVSSVDVGTDIGFLQMVDYMYVIFYIVEFSKIKWYSMVFYNVHWLLYFRCGYFIL